MKKLQEEALKAKREKMLHDEVDRGPKKEKPYKSWKDIVVEGDYSGPRLDDNGEVTS